MWDIIQNMRANVAHQPEPHTRAGTNPPLFFSLPSLRQPIISLPLVAKDTHSVRMGILNVKKSLAANTCAVHSYSACRRSTMRSFAVTSPPVALSDWGEACDALGPLASPANRGEKCVKIRNRACTVLANHPAIRAVL